MKIPEHVEPLEFFFAYSILTVPTSRPNGLKLFGKTPGCQTILFLKGILATPPKATPPQ